MYPLPCSGGWQLLEGCHPLTHSPLPLHKLLWLNIALLYTSQSFINDTKNHLHSTQLFPVFFKKPPSNSVFQAETTAINQAIKYLINKQTNNSKYNYLQWLPSSTKIIKKTIIKNESPINLQGTEDIKLWRKWTSRHPCKNWYNIQQQDNKSKTPLQTMKHKIK